MCGCVGELPAVSDLGAAALGDLLPDWYDDWLVLERERLRELRVRALERVCERLTAHRELRSPNSILNAAKSDGQLNTRFHLVSAFVIAR